MTSILTPFRTNRQTWRCVCRSRRGVAGGGAAALLQGWWWWVALRGREQDAEQRPQERDWLGVSEPFVEHGPHLPACRCAFTARKVEDAPGCTCGNHGGPVRGRSGPGISRRWTRKTAAAVAGERELDERLTTKSWKKNWNGEGGRHSGKKWLRNGGWPTFADLSNETVR